MTVTAIQPRKKSLYAFYIDGEFAMELDRKTVDEHGIRPGASITDEALHDLIQESNYRRAKEKALWLISYRDYSKKELVDKIKKTCDETSALAAAERMEELGLINDANYAKRYAAQLANIKNLSARNIQYKLSEKGIDRDLAREITQELTIDPRDQIRAVIEKKYAKILDTEKGVRRTVTGLQRMGHKWEDIKSVLHEYIEND